MDIDPSRLRRGEWLAGAGAALLLALMFLLPWYGLSGSAGATAATSGTSTSLNAWHSLTTLRWLMLLTILAALSLVFFQATRRAPALPVSLSVILTVLGGLTVLVLIYRELINPPGPDSLLHTRIGAFLGLVGACAIAVGAFASLREEGLSARDARTAIPTVRLRGEG
jgi:hypothetical protein